LEPFTILNSQFFSIIKLLFVNTKIKTVFTKETSIELCGYS
jgi:hypothetical protein